MDKEQEIKALEEENKDLKRQLEEYKDLIGEIGYYVREAEKI